MRMAPLSDQLARLAHPDGYRAVACHILNDTVLCCREQQSEQMHHFAIEDIEFYQHNMKEEPVDAFGHASPKQISCGGWYFHGVGRFKTGCAEGTYKGLDITFGPPNCVSGILLRRIRHLATNTTTEGPSRVVQVLLRLTGHAKARALEDQLRREAALSIFDTQSALHVIEEKVPLHEEGRLDGMWAIPRFGLSLREVHQGSLKYKFIKAPYRFTRHRPGLGKVHLFCAALDQMPIPELTTCPPDDVVARVCSHLGTELASKATLLGWLERYLAGFAKEEDGQDPLRSVASAHRPACVAFYFGYVHKHPYQKTGNLASDV